MSKHLAGLGGNAGAVAAGVVVVGVLALGAWIGSQRDVPARSTPTLAVQTQPEVGVEDPKPVTATATTPQTEDAPKVAESAPIPAPAFDEVRREADGMTVVAGRAVPGALVKLLKDGTEIATTTADGSGKFATLAMIAPDGAGHVLSLIQSFNGEDLASADEIILAPTTAPVVVAALDEGVAETKSVPSTTLEVVAEVQALASTEIVPAPEGAETVTVTAGEAAKTPRKDEAVNKAAEVAVQGTVAQENAPTAEVTKPVESVITADVVTPDASTAQAETTAAPKTETLIPEATTSAQEAVAEPVTEQVTEALAQAEPSAEPTAEVKEIASQVETPDPAPETTVAVLKSTAEGVELLNPTAPDVMDTVALDTISYSDAGDVQLAGRAQADTQAVRVYLDNDAVINLPVDDKGRWRGDVPNVDEGIYTLRVDEVGADGTVTSRVETPFKREAPAVLAQASEAQNGPIKAITVQAGATLWAIARDRYGDGRLYVRVVKANESSIRDPDLIYPGQIFDLPE
ncbi:MAG: peptigoglycan-binding protein LysM [Sulfitobacter sp.]